MDSRKKSTQSQYELLTNCPSYTNELSFNNKSRIEKFCFIIEDKTILNLKKTGLIIHYPGSCRNLRFQIDLSLLEKTPSIT
jgi:hypothetical protein